MADINFPDNPIEGDIFEDDNDNVWEYKDSRWGSYGEGIREYIGDMYDVDNSNPSDGKYLGINTFFENKYKPYDLNADDYFFRATFTYDWDFNSGTNTNFNNVIPFNSVTDEVGTSGAWSGNEYHIPVDGLYEIGCQFEIKTVDSYLDTYYSLDLNMWINKDSTQIHHIASHYTQNGNNPNADYINKAKISGSIILPLERFERLQFLIDGRLNSSSSPYNDTIHGLGTSFYVTWLE